MSEEWSAFISLIRSGPVATATPPFGGWWDEEEDDSETTSRLTALLPPAARAAGTTVAVRAVTLAIRRRAFILLVGYFSIFERLLWSSHTCRR